MPTGDHPGQSGHDVWDVDLFTCPFTFMGIPLSHERKRAGEQVLVPNIVIRVSGVIAGRHGVLHSRYRQ